MGLYKKILCLFLFYMFAATHGYAQRELGIAMSEWGAINSVYLNPANIADCHEKISISIFSMNFGINNNLGTFSKTGEFTSAGSGDFTTSGTKTFSMVIPELILHGPGIMVSINRKHSLALTSGFRIINQLNNFDQSLYNTVINPGSVSDKNYNITSKNFNWTAHVWSEVALTYAAVVHDKEKSEIKLGITLKRLGGIGYVSLTGNNIDLTYFAGADSFYASHSDIEFASNIVNDSTAALKGISSSNLLDKMFGQTSGSGFGVDIGISYRLKIGESEPSDFMETNGTHDVVFSASITDFGSIKYSDKSNAIIAAGGNGYLTGTGISKSSDNAATFSTYANQQGFFVDTTSKLTRVYLPTAFLLSADMQLHNRFYATLLFISNMANRQNFGNSYYNQITIMPRYDRHKTTLSLPITYSMLSHDMKIGIGYRISGYFIGSDDAMAFLSKNQRGFNIYMGGYIPLFKKNNDPAGIHWSR